MPSGSKVLSFSAWFSMWDVGLVWLFFLLLGRRPRRRDDGGLDTGMNEEFKNVVWLCSCCCFSHRVWTCTLRKLGEIFNSAGLTLSIWASYLPINGKPLVEIALPDF